MASAVGVRVPEAMDNAVASLQVSDVESGPSLDEVLAAAARGVCEALKADCAAISLLERGVPTFRAQYGLPDEVLADWRLDKDASQRGIVFRSGEPYISADITRDPSYAESQASRLGIRGVIMVPLPVSGDEIGCLYIGSFAPRRFTDDDVRVACVFAQQIAAAVANALLLDRERRERQRSQALLELVRAAGTSLSLKQALVQVCEAASSLSVADRCSILLLDEASETLEPFMSLGFRDEKMWQRFRAAARVPVSFVPGMRDLILTQRPILIRHASRTRLIPQSVVKDFGMKSVAIYPMAVRTQVIGIMVVDSVKDYLRFPQEEVETMTAIARQAAVIIDNALLFEREQKQRRRAEALLQVVDAASSSLSLKKVLINLCRSVVDLSVGERCSIFLIDKGTDRLVPYMSLGREDEAMWNKFRSVSVVPQTPKQNRLVEAITRIRAPIIQEDVPGTGFLPRRWVEDFGVKSVAIYPLVVNEETVGAMAVDSYSDFVHFPPEEVETLAAIARQAAVLIEHARLHEQVQQQAIADPLTGLYNHRHLYERLEQELARAKRSRCPVAVLMLDIDSLKLVNDTYGHQVGDEALKLLASVLQSSSRTEDIVGRYGGDEFMVILPEANTAEAERIGERIQANLAASYLEGKRKDGCVPVRLSMGVACYPSDATVMHELVDLADSALYRSKQRGGGRITTARGRVEELMPADSSAFSAMQGLVSALIQKEPAMRQHVGDVAKYSVLAAAALGLGEKDQNILRRAGWVHDVGKIAVPDGVLLKPGPLNGEEWSLIRQHVEFSITILRGIARLADIVPAVAAHHEWFDGSGYPRGLKGRRIPITARILSVADAYAAMTNDRPYRLAMSRKEAVEELQRGAGIQFDPQVVEAFVQVLEAEAGETRAA
jgi:diguanylate cyclase (GGDEF)-like protein